MRTATVLALVSPLLGLANGHIVQTNPKPYKFAEYGPSNPLRPDGSDFPCKIPPGVKKLEIDGAPTKMVIGAQQTLAFEGEAVHGGGSCQLALTEGFEPNSQSKWKVIHSIEGGCPKRNIKGNIEDGSSPDTFPYTIPDGIVPGKYTQAWVWINRIGQAVNGGGEIYMNCAPIEVLPAEGSTQRVRERREKMSPRADNFPGLYLANLGEVSNGCVTHKANVDQKAIRYPSPGASVVQPEGPDDLLDPPCDGNPRNSGKGGRPAVSAPSDEPQPKTNPQPQQPQTGSPAPAPAPAPTSGEQPSQQPETDNPPDSSEGLDPYNGQNPSPPAVSSPPPFSNSTGSNGEESGNEPEASTPNPPASEQPEEPSSQQPDQSSQPSTGSGCPDIPCKNGQLHCSADMKHFCTCTGGKWTKGTPLAEGKTCVQAGDYIQQSDGNDGPRGADGKRTDPGHEGQF